MAKTNETQKKANVFSKCIGFFKNLGIKIGHSFNDMFAELKKVTWPTRSELINYTLVVLAFIVAVGVVLFAIDTGMGALVQLITR